MKPDLQPVCITIWPNTARPHGTRLYWILSLMGHCFGLGPKILRYTVLHCLYHSIEWKFDTMSTSFMSGSLPETELNIIVIQHIYNHLFLKIATNAGSLIKGEVFIKNFKMLIWYKQLCSSVAQLVLNSHIPWDTLFWDTLNIFGTLNSVPRGLSVLKNCKKFFVSLMYVWLKKCYSKLFWIWNKGLHYYHYYHCLTEKLVWWCKGIV